MMHKARDSHHKMGIRKNETDTKSAPHRTQITLQLMKLYVFCVLDHGRMHTNIEVHGLLERPDMDKMTQYFVCIQMVFLSGVSND